MTLLFSKFNTENYFCLNIIWYFSTGTTRITYQWAFSFSTESEQPHKPKLLMIFTIQYIRLSLCTVVNLQEIKKKLTLFMLFTTSSDYIQGDK